MKRFISILILVCVVFVACDVGNDPTGNDNGNETNNNNGNETGNNNGNKTGNNKGNETSNNNGNETGNNNGNETGNTNGNETDNNNGNETGKNNGNEAGNTNGNETGNNNGNETGNNNGNETGNNNGNETGNNNGNGNKLIPMIFANENITIILSNDVPINLSFSIARKIVNDKYEGSYSYKIQQKEKGDVSIGTVIIDGNTLKFNSKKNKSFEAKITDNDNKKELNFSSNIQTDTGTSVNIGKIEEAILYKSTVNTEFAYLLHLGYHMFDIGYEENGIITFLGPNVIRGGSTFDFGQMLVSLGSHQYLFYECRFNNGIVNVSSKKIISWVPPYKSIRSDTFNVAAGLEPDSKNILKDAVIFDGVYKETEVSIGNINRQSMMKVDDGLIYENADNTELPYLLWNHGGFRLGIIKEDGIVTFLPVKISSSNSHDAEFIHQLADNQNIFVAYDFIDHKKRAVDVYISDIIPGSYYSININDLRNDLDTRILNNTVSGHYFHYTYDIIDYSIEWKIEY